MIIQGCLLNISAVTDLRTAFESYTVATYSGAECVSLTLFRIWPCEGCVSTRREATSDVKASSPKDRCKAPKLSTRMIRAQKPVNSIAVLGATARRSKYRIWQPVRHWNRLTCLAQIRTTGAYFVFGVAHIYHRDFWKRKTRSMALMMALAD